MDTGYQRDRKELYEKMMEEIGAHPDFGKRNPVDLGTECGYPEETVMEMIRFLQGRKDRQEMKAEKRGERKRYYFLLKDCDYFEVNTVRTEVKKRGRTRCSIVSVDINTWKVEQIKEVDKPAFFRIKENIYAWVDEKSGTELKWEDLEKGSGGEFHADSDIKDILIMEEGIVVVTTQGSFLLFRFHGEKTVISISLGIKGNTMLMEGRNAFYIISTYRGKKRANGSKIWKVEKEGSDIKEIFENSKAGVAIAEYTDEGLVWYVEEFSRGIVRRYVEKNLPDYEAVNAMTGSKNVRDYGCTEGIRTKNYRLLQRGISSIDRHGVCDFDRKMPRGAMGSSNEVRKYENDAFNGQVVGIYDKDIFIGVTWRGRLIRIDLRNEKNPVVLSPKNGWEKMVHLT